MRHNICNTSSVLKMALWSLVRPFTIGTGTQPEGCVVHDENEVIFIGEETHGLWKYGANPEDPGTGAGVLVDSVDKAAGGNLNAGVEGMALVYGKTEDYGYLIVSAQGVSAYTVCQS
jgi:3-phytase